MTKVHNFSAGPSILPDSAIQESIKGLQNFKGTHLPVVSVSHRSPEWEEVMNDAVHLVKKLLNVPEGYEVLFLQGGASTQFMQVAFNFISEEQPGAYLNTGTWSKKAIKEAKLFGKVNVVASSEDKNFNYIPKDYSTPSHKNAYFHITTNNTIFGTQIKSIPNADCPIIADMSSDIFSRPIDVSKFSLIYAGAQKNMGPAGVTLVIAKKEFIAKRSRSVPSMMNYELMASKGSMFNTPPVFPIYLSYLTLKWVEEQGGLAAIEKRNQEKADLIYDEIDRNPLFEGTAAKEDRSHMNATFVAKNEAHHDAFMAMTKAKNLSGLKGHRSVGGFRASIYNALPLESVQALVSAMQEFSKENA